MARETKAQIAERLLAEQKAQERAKKVAEKKALKMQEKSEPQMIVVDFSTDVKTILKNLTEAIAKNVSNDYDAIKAVSTQIKQASFPHVKADEPKIAKVKETLTPELVNVSLTKIRELINDKAGENKTVAIVKLLDEFGASSASTLLEEHYNNFFEALQKL